MGVGEAVVDVAALAPSGDDTRGAEQPEGLGDGRLGGTGRGGEVADAELAGLEEGIEQSGAGRVAEQLEDAGDAGELVDARGVVGGEGDLLGVHAGGGAPVESGDGAHGNPFHLFG